MINGVLMTPVGALYILFTTGLVVTGLVLIGAAVRAYSATGRESMVYLSVGFTLIVAAAIATAVGAILNDFQNVRGLLLVNNGFTMGGYILVLYSVVSR